MSINKDLICGASKEKLEENYWVAGLNMNKLFCVVLKAPDLFPLVRWVETSTLSFSFLFI